jgi:hypothetical protein
MPLEPLTADRDSFTVFVPPASLADTSTVTLTAIPADPSSTVRVDLPSWPLSNRALSAQTGPEGTGNFDSYRQDTPRTITVATAAGRSKTYAVTIVWAKLIDHPDEIRDNLEQDYYLKRGTELTLTNWVPIGTDNGYTVKDRFRGSLRGNGRTLQIDSIRGTAAGALTISQGLFLILENAVIEDLHVQVNAVYTSAENAGALTGIASHSLIQRVKTSGVLYNSLIPNTGTAAIHVGGISGSLAGGAVIYNSVAAVDVTGNIPATYAGGSSFYMGGAAGRQVQDPIAAPFSLSPGGYIFNTLARGSVTVSNASLPAIAGGITGGGGGDNDTNVLRCVVLKLALNAGGSGGYNFILGQWLGPTGSTHNTQNYYHDEITPTGGPLGGAGITGTGRSDGDLRQQSSYANAPLKWDFGHVWKMGADGFPALSWE